LALWGVLNQIHSAKAQHDECVCQAFEEKTGEEGSSITSLKRLLLFPEPQIPWHSETIFLSSERGKKSTHSEKATDFGRRREEEENSMRR
jgi:hypothetical protein